jgi:hypothetical protein
MLASQKLLLRELSGRVHDIQDNNAIVKDTIDRYVWPDYQFVRVLNSARTPLVRQPAQTLNGIVD